MLVAKTGMTVEHDIVKKYVASDVLVLVGNYTVETLYSSVPNTCQAIISMGVCGGLASDAIVGKPFIYDTVVTANATYSADIAWSKRLFAVTQYYECHCWSTSQFNTANTVEQRAALAAKTGCKVIDDETWAVAEYAAGRNIPWIGLRVVSDSSRDNLPEAVVNALNPDGSDNIEDVIKSVVEDPLQIPSLIETAANAQKAFTELHNACVRIGPHCQFLA